MKRYFVISVIMMIVIFVSCSDDDKPTGPGNSVDDSFSLSVSVKDASGDPLPDIRISAWNRGPVLGHKATSGYPRSKMPSATISFELADSSYVTLSVYDLNDQLKMTLVDDTMSAGSHNVSLGLVGAGISQVFRIVLLGEGLTSGIELADTTLAYLWQPDQAVGIIGYTNAQGRFGTTDSLPFPNLFDLPQLPRSDYRGTVFEPYDISDTVHFVFTDTVADSSMSLDVAITNGPNEFQVLWDPTDASRGQKQLIGDGRKLPKSTGAAVQADSVNLFIFPNPFN